MTTPTVAGSHPSGQGYADETATTAAAAQLALLRANLARVLFGQDDLIDRVVTGLVAGGHILLEGLPGLGKTELVKGLARSIQLQAGRVQFTPDLLPGDITGNPILQDTGAQRRFAFQPGPIFVNLLLADEINRASPKTQSALLEAMQERRVTVMGESHPLPQPFFVLATQNPIELEGTYALPEAQLDRFLFKLDVPTNPPEVLERIVLERRIGEEVTITPVMTATELSAVIATGQSIYMPPVVANFIARLVDGTHPGRSKSATGVRFGASPRAALALAASARARALGHGRLNASFEDVVAVARPVLRHRVILDYNARLDGRTTEDVLTALLTEVQPVGRALPTTLVERP